MRLPKKPVEALKARWGALAAKTPWARLGALEARLEAMRVEVKDARQRVDDLRGDLEEYDIAEMREALRQTVELLQSHDLQEMEDRFDAALLELEDMTDLPGRIAELEETVHRLDELRAALVALLR